MGERRRVETRVHPLAAAALPSLHRHVEEILAEAAYAGQYAMLIAGTAISENYTPSSDIDVFVVHEANWRQRCAFRAGEYRLDITLLPVSEVRAAYKSYHAPGVLDAFASGLAVRDFNGTLLTLKLEAERAYAAGPPPMSSAALALWRYRLSVALDSIAAPRSDDRWNALRLADLTRDALETHLRARRVWKPNVKNLLAVARAHGHPAVARALCEPFSLLDRDAVAQLIKAVLDSLGGPLGSWRTAREEARK